MKHTMKSVMSALERAKADGDRRLPVMTSNQCHALAVELNKDEAETLREQLQEARKLLDIASVRLATWLTYAEEPRKQIIEFLDRTK